MRRNCPLGRALDDPRTLIVVIGGARSRASLGSANLQACRQVGPGGHGPPLQWPKEGGSMISAEIIIGAKRIMDRAEGSLCSPSTWWPLLRR